MSEPERRSNHGGEAPKTDWALEVRRRREAVPTAQLEALKQRVGREFAQALRARQAGNEGRARVCARRAAGWAIAELFAEQASTDERRNALRMLAWLEKHIPAPMDLREAAGRLTTRLEPGFIFPHPQDPLEDARRILDQLLGRDWRAGEAERGGLDRAGPPEPGRPVSSPSKSSADDMRDLRGYARTTNRRLVLGGIGMVLLVGGALIAVFYGPQALAMALLCFGAFAIPAGLIAFLLGWMEWIVRRERD